MSKKYKIYNLNFLRAEYFQPFAIDGYNFYPIVDKQPKRRLAGEPIDFLKINRKMVVNAYVTIPSRQKDSVFRKGGKYSRFRKIKFLEDLLVIISICIGKNVIPKFHEQYLGFPIISAKHCEQIANNSGELETALQIAYPRVLDKAWQDKYSNGFHINMFYNATNILSTEQRFLADVTVWEFIFFCNHREMGYDRLRSVNLNTKIKFLIKKYLLEEDRKLPEEQFRIFSDIRNQLSHTGQLPIRNPKSPFRNLGWVGCKSYMKFFQHLSQVLVLKTIGIEAIGKMDVFDVKSHLNEIVENGSIEIYKQMDESGLDF